MTLWWVSGQVVDDQQQSIPEGATRVNMFRNPAQYGSQEFAWSPENRYFSGNIQSNAPAYLTTLLGRLDRQRRGEQLPWYEADELAQWEATARAMPTRDIASLRAGWQGEQTENPQWWSLLDPGSPDAGPIMLNLRDRIQHGTATPQERQLYQQVATMAADWDYRASVPQESDANPFGLGDNLMGALMMLGMGASAGSAAMALAASGLTLGSVAGLAGVASGLTNLLAEPLDSAALRQAGLALGVVGGATSLASLLSNGLNSVGDVVKAVQKVYGTGTKAMNMINAVQSAGKNPAAVQSALKASQGRTAGSTTQASTASTAAGSTPGGNAMAESNLDIGTILSGIVGSIGSGISLADVSRYMGQLKSQYGDKQETKDLIDEAYRLAVARYETYYARSEQEYAQKQEAYTKAQERYQTRYDQQQQTWGMEQKQFEKIEAQTDQDRAAQYENYWQNRAKVDESYNRQVQEAKEERDYQVSRDSANVAKYDAAFNEQAAQAKQDRDTQYRTYDQQFSRHTAREDQRAAQAVEERGLDINAYQQRQAVGRNLADPSTVAAGAKAIYEPLSEAARDRINVQTEEEMARRGVAGGGQYSNLMAAKAFAPLEQQMWQNSLQQYIAAQQGAANAYTQQDLTMTPEYRWAARPEFTQSPEYRAIAAPNLAGSPEYRPLGSPQFTQSTRQSVPHAPGYEQYPGVPTYTTPAGQPTPNATFFPEPYAPYGTDPKTGQTAQAGLDSLIKTLTRTGVPQALIGQVAKWLGLGSNTQVPASFLSPYGDETQQPWYDANTMELTPGIDYPVDNFDYTQLGPDYDYWA